MNAEYEVLRVEGVDSGDEIRVDPEISFNKESFNKMKKGKRKRGGECGGGGNLLPPTTTKEDSPTKVKRLRLLMGNEKLSTVNYS